MTTSVSRLKVTHGLDSNNLTITNVADPVSDQDALTLHYGNLNYQPLDADLTAIGAIAGTTGYLKKTGANTWELGIPGATGGGTDMVFYLNDQVVHNSYSIPANSNAGTFGPVTVDAGVTVTIPDGSTWTIA